MFSKVKNCYTSNIGKKFSKDFHLPTDGKPWLPIEVKLSDTTPSKNWNKFLTLIGCKHALQVVNKSHWKVHKFDNFNILVYITIPAYGIVMKNAMLSFLAFLYFNSGICFSEPSIGICIERLRHLLWILHKVLLNMVLYSNRWS
jgi:hypothetical protein